MPEPETTSPKRRRKGFESTGALLAGALKGPAAKRGFGDAKLLTHWAEIAGAEIAKIARPVKITYGRGFGGTLHLLTTGGNAPVLEMQKAAVIERVNACFGYRAVSRIHVTQTAPTGFAEGQVAFGTKPKAKPRAATPPSADVAQKLNTIEDPDLRGALARLASNVAMTKGS